MDHSASERETRGCRFKGICKSFGRQRVLHDLELQVQPEELTLLLGANGSGKSTLLRICVGLSRADKGEVTIDGEALGRSAYKSIGHAGHDLFLYRNLTVGENLKLFSSLNRNSASTQSFLDSWNLSEHRDKRISELSKGQRARLSLCRTFLHNPKYLFLDEPTSSLDERTLDFLMERVRAAVKEGGCALIATHDVKRLSEHATRVLVLRDGRIAKDLSAIREAAPERSVEDVREEVIESYLEDNR